MRHQLYFLICLSVVTLYLLSACNSNEPKLSVAEVHKIASEVAIDRGIDLKEYDLDDIEYDPSDETWRLYYDGRQRIIGDHFGIWIHDKTSKIDFFGGA